MERHMSPPDLREVRVIQELTALCRESSRTRFERTRETLLKTQDRLSTSQQSLARSRAALSRVSDVTSSDGEPGTTTRKR
jgi:hypothetical protein